MFLVVLALLLVWPVVEIVAAREIAEVIGPWWTLLALVAVSVAGSMLLKRSGLGLWRRANAEVAAGRPPTRQLLDGALLLIGGVALIVPGFVSGAFGALLMLPPVRAVLRPALVAWMGARAARAARSGRLRGVMVDTVVGPDGQVRRRSRTFGDVIDAEGWELAEDPGELPRGFVDRDGPGDPTGPKG